MIGDLDAYMKRDVHEYTERDVYEYMKRGLYIHLKVDVHTYMKGDLDSLHRTATRCNTPATHCNTLQHTATHCNIYEMRLRCIFKKRRWYIQLKRDYLIYT